MIGLTVGYCLRTWFMVCCFFGVFRGCVLGCWDETNSVVCIIMVYYVWIC